jgi:RNA polymerase sigma factor (sigma-70 family)
MAGGSQGSLVRSIHTLFDAGATGSLSDSQLLERFLDRRGEAAEAAFEALVVRHGPMVFDVCRGVLGATHDHDVEDAFQATFLVLACKAASIRRRESLASWLFGVARRVASRALSEAARRRAHERKVAEMNAAASGPTQGRPDLSVLIDEVENLPAKYREPVILCYLQGVTYEAAAQRLSCPLGTLSVRLKRARERLRDRLTRRGIAEPAELFSAGIAPRVALPAPLVASAVRAAVSSSQARAVVSGIASATVVTLTRGALRSMFLNRLKVVAATLLSVALGAGLWSWRASASGNVGKDVENASKASAEPTAPVQERQEARAGAPQQDKGAVGKFQMAGRVRDEATGEPVAGATVEIWTGDSSRSH